MDEDEQLYNTVRWRAKSNSSKAKHLGEVVKQLMENRISPQQARFAKVIELWSCLLPAELRRHCKLADISAGQLKVLVDSSTHLYELQLCSSQLLKEVQLQCPKARIKEIKFAIGVLT